MLCFVSAAQPPQLRLHAPMSGFLLKQGYKLHNIYKTPGCCQRVSTFDRRECDAQGEKMRCLSEAVTHLKAVKGDKHAIKNFDRELECKNPCFAKAAAIEAVVPCK